MKIGHVYLGMLSSLVSTMWHYSDVPAQNDTHVESRERGIHVKEYQCYGMNSSHNKICLATIYVFRNITHNHQRVSQLDEAAWINAQTPTVSFAIL